ncbi:MULTISPECIES: hypothetical protein [unclassified Streptomyces]|uniref:DUF6907 domain-containing protein n=1 Tax=unclassified Streptomyces TaxID=2593676 RepID=UPI0033DBC060
MQDPIRSITLPTIDHGDITIPCPPWCAGHDTTPQYRADLTHEGTERILSIPTKHGPVALLVVAFEQRPYAENWPGTAPFVNVGFGGDYHPMRRPALHAAADALMDQAAVLRRLADELGELLGGDQ